jgi:CheY-like chemotaxis protein
VHPAADAAIVQAVDLADLTGVRVLVVDDDADSLRMVEDALAAAGATMFAASDAGGALAILDRETCDVAVLDIGMPHVDGYELLGRIRSRPRTRQGAIPAAALTAYARTVDRTRALKAGFQMHLAKPVQPTELTAAVLALADGRHDRNDDGSVSAEDAKARH